LILGVDHIALASRDLSADGAALAGLGFTERFRDAGVPNAAVKRSLQAQHRDIHDLAIHDHPGSVALELTVHAPQLVASGHLGFVPVIAGVAAPPLARTAAPLASEVPAPPGVAEALYEALGITATWQPVPELGAAVWSTKAQASTTVPACACCVADLAASTRFFRDTLKARALAAGTSGGRAWQALELFGPVMRWRLRVLLVAAIAQAEREPLLLDSAGFPCIALLTSDIAKDGNAIESALGRPIDGRFGVGVNGKSLEIALARGPSAEFVELIQVRRG